MFENTSGLTKIIIVFLITMAVAGIVRMIAAPKEAWLPKESDK